MEKRVSVTRTRSARVVLIVEDDAPLRQYYRQALSSAGFDVREVSDGYDALQYIDTNDPPDVIVLDLMLPRINGRLVREDLAAHPQTRNIPVVIVTGTSGIELLQVEAEAVLRKPVSAERLIEVVQRCLDVARKQ
jgi:CheY-like chemotaxis protein